MRSHEFITEDVTQSELNLLRHYLNDRFRYLDVDINFTTHFYNRVNDERNGKPITIGELTRLFREELKTYGKQFEKLPTGYEAVLKDIATKINVPIAVTTDPDGDVDMTTKTVMRKKNFHSLGNPEYVIGN